MRGSASFDRSGRYRYSLLRTWNPAQGRVAFVMLNPSTADAEQNDPTIRRCLGYARDWGYGSLEVVNLFAFRATQPNELFRAAAPVGPRNAHYLRRAADAADLMVLAWGFHGARTDHHRQVWRRLARRRTLTCLRLLASGQPAHPLYLPRDLKPTLLPSPSPSSISKGLP